MNEQPNTQKSGGNKVTVIITVIVIILVALGIAGYFASKFLARKAAESIINSATGGKVKTADDGSAALNFGNESIKTGNFAKWPTDLPISLEAPQDVKIESVSKNTELKTWTITLSSIPTNTIYTYTSELKDKGWQVVSETDVFIKITQLEKENWVLNISYDESNRSALLTISPKAEN